MSHKSYKYRPDIDGLRALAVLLVVVFHIWGTSFIPGGFIGVDVFFVISGFLITQIISREVGQKTFTFASFYMRRIRRLMPAFILVIICTNLFALYAFLPADLIEYSKSQISASLFISNFFLWRVAGGYFASNADFIPLLHTWSLAVEEQFYLIWPICLILLVKFVRQAIHFWLILLVTVACIYLSEWGVKHYLAASYYLFPTRAFELLMGVFLALSWKKLPPMPAAINNVLSLTGAVCILLPSMLLNEFSLFPGINALWPCLGAVLIIYSGKTHAGIVNRILSLKPLVVIGLISYPLYLWHWPIISFSRYYLVDIQVIEGIVIIALSILLSFLTWKYVERPWRKQVEFNFKPVLIKLFFMPTLVIILIPLVTLHYDGFPQRFSEGITFKNKAVMSFSHQLRGGCNQGNVVTPLEPDKCRLGAIERKEVDILLVGDSHANAITGMIDVMAKDANMRAYDITQSNTYPLFGVNMGTKRNGETDFYANFRARNDFLYALIENTHYKYVVLAGTYNSYFTKGGKFLTNSTVTEFTRDNTIHLFRSSLRQSIAKIIESGATPVLVEDVPNMPEDLSRCSLNNELLGFKRECSTPYADIDAKQRKAVDVFHGIKTLYPQTIIINPKLVICDSSRCYADIDQTPLYRDKGHLNDVGSRLVGERYLEKYGNPFIRNNGTNRKMGAHMRLPNEQ